MKNLLIPTLAILLLFGCKKNVEDNAPPADMPQYAYGYLDSAHSWSTWYPKNTKSKVRLDNTVVHGGKYSVAILGVGDSGKYGLGVGRGFTNDYFLGNRIRFSYWAKTKDVTGKIWAVTIAYKGMGDIPTDPSTNPFTKFNEFIEETTGIDLESKKATLSKHAFGYDGVLEPANIESTSDWKQYHLELDVPTKTYNVIIGFRIEGKGSLWIDDITYEKIKKLPIDSGYVDRSQYFAPLTGLDFE
jgi:hypothetical protein